MKKILLILWVGLFVLTACQPAAATAVPATKAPSPQDVANAWQAALNSGNIDAALSYLAPDAVVTISPAGPEGDAVFTGQDEVRGWYETITGAKGITTLSGCKVDGENITCLDTYADEGFKSMGADFIEGSWAAVVRDGKIQSYVFTMSPESLAKLAPPPAPTSTTIPPTATFLPESLAVSVEEFTGVWKLRWSDTATLFMEIKLYGEYRLTFQDGAEVGKGTFSFDGGRLTWRPTAGCSNAPTAEYDVYVTKQGERTMQIRFSLVGEDKCVDRKDTNNQLWDTANP